MKTTSPQARTDEKTKEDKGLFLQLPYILIDTLNLSDSAYRGFINFCRQCLQKDKTIRYSGSYRQLAAYIQQSRMTCYRSVEQWITANLITKEDTPDGFILTGDLSAFWSKNAEHCKAHQRPKVGQVTTSTASQSGTSKAEQRPNFSSTASQNKHSSVPTLDANEHENDPLYTVIDTLEDTFFSDGESGSYSQDVEQPEMPEKKGPSMADWFAELDAKMDALDREYSSRLQENKAHQFIDILTSQESVPAQKSAAPKLPDMTKDLNQQDVRAVTPTQQKRIDAAERKAEEKRIRDREDDLWRMVERIAGVVVKTAYAIGSIKAMAQTKMSLEDIEIVMQKYADAGMFDLTKIANYLPTYAARKQRKQSDEPAKITQFPSKGYQPAQPEVIPWKSKTPANLGAHLNPADYDEEPYVATR